MGKGQVSEKELEKGIKSLGGLTGLTGSSVRRDSPFGSDFVKTVPAPVREPLTLEKVIDLEVKTEERLPEAEPPSDVVDTPRTRLSKEERAPKRRLISSKEEGEKDTEERIFTERITLQMKAEMRDDLHYLATKLQRRKTNKDERITSNTVMRAAIQFLLDELKLKESDVVNTEAELLSLMKRKLLSK